jgi:hypothetical protein
MPWQATFVVILLAIQPIRLFGLLVTTSKGLSEMSE